MTTFLHDLRFAWRALVRNKRFATTIVATLALGIATTTVIFSILDGVVLNPFPYPSPGSLVSVGTEMPKLQQALSFFENLSPAEYLDIKDGSQTLTKVVAWDMGNRQVTEGNSTENAFSAFWWGDALPTLGVVAAVGRGFTDEEIRSRAHVAMVSHRFWRTRLGADPARVGGPLLVNGEPYTLVGVLPERTLIYGTDLWLPMSVGPEVYPRGRRQFQILARIADGRTMDDVNNELRVIAERLDQSYGSSQPEYENLRFVAQTFVEVNVGVMRPAAAILSLASLFVLAIACVNVASLLLSRAMERSREMAMRVTLGARRAQILRQLICESTLFAVAGAFVGALLASQGVGLLRDALSRVLVPIPGEISLSVRVLVATLVLSVVCGVLFGLAPALHTLRHHTQAALRAEGAAITGGTRRLRAHRFFVGFQMAFAALLVACSGLLVRSLIELNRVNAGVASKEILGFRATLPAARYDGRESFARFFESMERNLAEAPGVRAAGLATQTPPSYFSRQSFLIEGEEVQGEGALKTAFFTQVSPGYFNAMGLTLRAGRLLNTDDHANAPSVAVINEAAAAIYFKDGRVLGRRLRFGRNGEGPIAEIVGIVSSAKNRGLDRDPAQEVFVTLRQSGYPNQLMTVVRAQGDPIELVPMVREAVKRLDPLQPIYQVQTVEQAFAAQGLERRIATFALLIFASFALLLAAAGVYSVASYAAAARTREIGVRMAIGANAAQVRRLVVRQALVPVTIGGVAGVLAAIPAGLSMGRILFGVRGYDPAALIVSLAALAVIAFAAADGPARRASRTNVVQALGTD